MLPRFYKESGVELEDELVFLRFGVSRLNGRGVGSGRPCVSYLRRRRWSNIFREASKQEDVFGARDSAIGQECSHQNTTQVYGGLLYSAKSRD